MFFFGGRLFSIVFERTAVKEVITISSFFCTITWLQKAPKAGEYEIEAARDNSKSRYLATRDDLILGTELKMNE